MTEKLYDINPYIKEFKATVLECFECEKGFAIVLDRTAFFYEGGGQPADTGTLGAARVLDARMENGVIYHYTDAPLKKGEAVEGKLDFNRRFAFMQNHTGEHLVSGILHYLYGFDNVGFHLNEEFATLDFNGELTRQQLDEVEDIANSKVWQNLPVMTYYPDADKLASLNYRSKKEIDGDIRIVEIANTDMCACCAPHVKTTGEIGTIKLLDFERMRGGTRVVLKCGAYALLDYRKKYENAVRISSLLSSKQNEVADAVDKLNQKLDEEKLVCNNLSRRMIDYVVNSAASGDRAVFVCDFEMKELQMLADSLHKSFGELRGAFSQNELGYAFALCGEEDTLSKVFAEFKQKFTVRGGGRGTMVQGSVQADKEDIKLFFNF